MRRIVVLGYGMAGHHLVARLARIERRAAGGDFAQTGHIAPARINRPIPADTAFTLVHWSGTARAKVPEFKTCAVRLEKAPAPHAAAHPADTEGTGE